MSIKIFIALPLSLLFISTNLSAQDEFALDSEEKTYSYAIGTSLGERLVQQFSVQPGINIEALLQGLIATVSGETPLMTAAEANAAIEKKQQELLAEANAKAQEKIAAGQIFLEENKNADGVVTTESGIQYRIETSGEGDSPAASDTVVVHYHGTLVDGTVFDSSYDRGEPATFSLGSIIPGWQEVLQLMKPGDKWSVVLPPELAYGEKGAGQLIGPNEVLLFDIELLEIKKSSN